MNIAKKFISEYGIHLLLIITTGIISYIGLQIKNIIKTLLNHKTKIQEAEMIYHGIEELYKNLTPKEKIQKMITNLEETIKEKNIIITQLEANILLHSIIHKEKNNNRLP